MAKDAGFRKSGISVGYGVVLRNVTSLDALRVTVAVNLLDSSGAVLASDSQELVVIPAKATFYLGGETFVRETDRPTKIETRVETAETSSPRYALPEVSRVTFALDPTGLGVGVRGQIRNTLNGPLAPYSHVGIVLFGHGGEIVGGGNVNLEAPLPQGAVIGFDTGEPVYNTPLRLVRTARVTVEGILDGGRSPGERG